MTLYKKNFLRKEFPFSYIFNSYVKDEGIIFVKKISSIFSD